MTSLLKFFTSGNDSDNTNPNTQPNTSISVPENKVMCLKCGALLGRLSYTHLKMHGMTVAEYREEFPGAPFMNEKERKGISDRPGMSEEARKAPMISPIGTPGRQAISRAAPGVDQAVSTGLRKYSDRPMHVLPMPKPSASNHELMCAGPAPAAEAAWNTMAAELV